MIDMDPKIPGAISQHMVSPIGFKPNLGQIGPGSYQIDSINPRCVL